MGFAGFGTESVGGCFDEGRGVDGDFGAAAVGGGDESAGSGFVGVGGRGRGSWGGGVVGGYGVGEF